MIIGSSRNFGSQLIGGSAVQFPPADNKVACRFQNDSGADLLVTKFHGCWSISQGTTCKVKAVIYADNAGVPGNLLAISDERIGLPQSWNTLTFSTPITIAANEWVWFGVISDTTLSSYACSTGGTILYNSNAYSAGPSASFGNATSVAFTYRMFLEGMDGTRTFGRRSIDLTGMVSTDGNYQPDREHIEMVTLYGTDTVVINSISTYITNTNATVKSKAAIYRDSSGYPGALIAQSAEVTGSTANTWLTLPLSDETPLAPGDYWLAFIANENLTTPVIPFTGHLIVDGPLTESGAWPSTYPTTGGVSVNNPASDGRGIDIYASYTIFDPAAARILEAASAISTQSANVTNANSTPAFNFIVTPYIAPTPIAFNFAAVEVDPSIVETGSATDTVSIMLATQATLVEPAAATSTESAASHIDLAMTEATAAISMESCGIVYSVGITEPANASDANNAVVSFFVSITETAIATDSDNVLDIVTVTEPATASDMASAMLTYALSIAEAGSATEISGAIKGRSARPQICVCM